MNHEDYIGKTLNDLMKDNSFGSFAINFYEVYGKGYYGWLRDVLDNEELLSSEIYSIRTWSDWHFCVHLEPIKKKMYEE